MSWQKEKIDYTTYVKPSDFLVFRVGDNTIRIVSDGFIMRKHQFRAQGRFVSMDCTGVNCDQCKAGIEHKLRYCWIVLDRDTGKLKVLETGKSLGHEIAMLGKAEDIRTFDIVVTRKGSDRSTTYKARKVVGDQITAEEKKIVTEYLPKLIEQYL